MFLSFLLRTKSNSMHLEGQRNSFSDAEMPLIQSRNLLVEDIRIAVNPTSRPGIRLRVYHANLFPGITLPTFSFLFQNSKSLSTCLAIHSGGSLEASSFKVGKQQQAQPSDSARDRGWPANTNNEQLRAKNT
jgi:hypothetical protein